MTGSSTPSRSALVVGQLEADAAREQRDDELVERDALLGGEGYELLVQLGRKAGEDGATFSACPPLTALGDHVASVVTGAPHEEMVRSHAGRVVAFVEDEQAIRYRPVREFPRDAVGACAVAISGGPPVALGIARSGPQPAVVSLGDLGPETFRHESASQYLVERDTADLRRLRDGRFGRAGLVCAAGESFDLHHGCRRFGLGRFPSRSLLAKSGEVGLWLHKSSVQHLTTRAEERTVLDMQITATSEIIETVLATQRQRTTILAPMDRMEHMIRVLTTNFPGMTRDEAAGHVTDYAINSGMVTF